MTENNNDDYAVLFVDDEEKALKYFSKALAGRFKVFTAPDVDAAEDILKAKSDQIAIVVSDQRMPGRNGVELLKKVRAQYPGMMRLLTTAYSDLNDAIEAINRGEIYRYIQKPWKVESLQAEVAGAMDYFLLRRERDLLLAEKLSTRQRMTGIERINQLVVFARIFDGLRNADYALKNFLEQLHTLPGTWESDGLGRVDQWELTKWETKRITDYIQGTTRGLLDGLPSFDCFDDKLTATQLAEMNDQLAGEYSVALSIEWEAGMDSQDQNWAANRALLEKLIRNVFVLFTQLQDAAQPVSLTISKAKARIPTTQAFALSFRIDAPSWPNDRHLLSGSALTDVHSVYQRVLACTLLAAHHGGSCTLDYNRDYLTLTVVLPIATDPASLSLPELGWEWLPEVLSYYEPEIDEFYHDL
jgi:ActR/RegA family two-component response regulator